MKGWKAYDHGLVCRGKQYEVGKTYEEPEALLGEKGMHFCDNPADLMRFHHLIDDSGKIMEVTTVDASGTIDAIDDSVSGANIGCATKLKINHRVDFGMWVERAIGHISDSSLPVKYLSDGECAIVNRRGSRQVNSKSLSCIIGAEDDLMLASCGEQSDILARGHNCSFITQGGYNAIVSIGGSNRIASSAVFSVLAEFSGFNGEIASTGANSLLISVGVGQILTATGDETTLFSFGSFSHLAAYGKDSIIVALGAGSWVKGPIGTWIVMSPPQAEKSIVKIAQVDGERIKADTWYTLKGGEFVETEQLP